MRRHTFKENLISAILGIVIGIPFSLYAVHAQEEQLRKTRSQEIAILRELHSETIYYSPIEEDPTYPPYCPELHIETITEEDIAEELYWDELDLLACCVMAEAGNQDLMGKRMVVDVVLNRVDDPDFPDTITEVITQPYQFSTYWNGAIESVDPTDDCFKAITMELETRSYPGILYFTAGRYNDYGTPWKKYGDHYFSTK